MTIFNNNVITRLRRGNLNFEFKKWSIIPKLFDPDLLITEVGYTLGQTITIEASVNHSN